MVETNKVQLRSSPPICRIMQIQIRSTVKASSMSTDSRGIVGVDASAQNSQQKTNDQNTLKNSHVFSSFCYLIRLTPNIDEAMHDML
jgi:hypothetical protein